MAGGNPGKLARDGRQRHEDDKYRTPPPATVAALRFLDLPQRTVIWECAGGDGIMVDAIRNEGYPVVASDLRPRRADISALDFLQAKTTPLADVVITNPPFKLLVEFVERALSFPTIRVVAMLTKIQVWNADCRAEFFERHGPNYFCPLTWRLNFLEGQGRWVERNGVRRYEMYKNPTMDCAWNIWIRGMRGPPQTHLLRKPR